MLQRVLRFLKFLYYTIITLPRDVKGLYILGKTKKEIEVIDRNPIPVWHIFKQWAKKYGHKKECIVFDDQIWTFQDVKTIMI